MRAETVQIIELAKGGMQPRDIAHKLNLNGSTVHSALRYARLKGERIPLFQTSAAGSSAEPALGMEAVAAVEAKSIVLPNRLHSLLAREAERRGKTPSETAQRLLEDALLRGVQP